MPLDRTDLANEALSILFADNGTGQAPDPEDTEFVVTRIEPLTEELDARGVVSIADLDDIPPAYFSALAELLANEVAPKFGRQKSPAVREDGEERLRTMVNRGETNAKLDIDPALKTGPVGYSLARWTRGI